MSRLTIRNGMFIEDGTRIQDFEGYHTTSSDANRFAKKEIEKLGQLEDVLEEFNIESVQELKARLQSESQLSKAGYELALENEELTKQLSKAIVPKFEIGSKLYMIPTQRNGLKEIKDYTLLSISLSDIGVRYDLSLNTKQSGVEPFYSASEEMFGNSIFATKAEAEQKLKELEGK